MKVIAFKIDSEIKRPVDEVRSHFADYIYHSKHEVHKGIKFTVHKQDARESHYRQEVTILGMPQKDEAYSRINPDGSLTTEVMDGANKGFKIHIVFRAKGAEATMLHADFTIPVSGFKALIAPLFKMAAIKIASGAVAEDTADLESGRYARYLESQRSVGGATPAPMR